MTFDLDLVNATAWGWTVLGLGLAKGIPYSVALATSRSTVIRVRAS